MWFQQESWIVSHRPPPFNWFHNTFSRMESMETVQIQVTKNPLLPSGLFSEQIVQHTLIYYRSLNYHRSFHPNHSLVCWLQVGGLPLSSLALKALPTAPTPNLSGVTLTRSQENTLQVWLTDLLLKDMSHLAPLNRYHYLNNSKYTYISGSW